MNFWEKKFKNSNSEIQFFKIDWKQQKLRKSEGCDNCQKRQKDLLALTVRRSEKNEGNARFAAPCQVFQCGQRGPWQARREFLKKVINITTIRKKMNLPKSFTGISWHFDHRGLLSNQCYKMYKIERGNSLLRINWKTRQKKLIILSFRLPRAKTCWYESVVGGPQHLRIRNVWSGHNNTILGKCRLFSFGKSQKGIKEVKETKWSKETKMQIAAQTSIKYVHPSFDERKKQPTKWNDSKTRLLPQAPDIATYTNKHHAK